MSPSDDSLYGPEINTARDRHALYVAQMFRWLVTMDRARRGLDVVWHHVSFVEQARRSVTMPPSLRISEYGPAELDDLARFHGKVMAYSERLREAEILLPSLLAAIRSSGAESLVKGDDVRAACAHVESFLVKSRGIADRALDLATRAEEAHMERIIRALDARFAEAEVAMLDEVGIGGFFTAARAAMDTARSAFYTALIQHDIPSARKLLDAFSFFAQNIASFLRPRTSSLAYVAEIDAFRRVYVAQVAQMTAKLAGALEVQAYWAHESKDGDTVFIDTIHESYDALGAPVCTERYTLHGSAYKQGESCYADLTLDVQGKCLSCNIEGDLCRTREWAWHEARGGVAVPLEWCPSPDARSDLDKVLGPGPFEPDGTPGAERLRTIERWARDARNDDPGHAGDLDVLLDDVSRFGRAQHFFAREAHARGQELEVSIARARSLDPADIVLPKDFAVVKEELGKIRAFPVNTVTTTLGDLILGQTFGDAYDIMSLPIVLTTGHDLWGEPVPAIDAALMAVTVMIPCVSSKQMKALLEQTKKALDIMSKAKTAGDAIVDWRKMGGEIADVAGYVSDVGKMALQYLRNATTIHIRTSRPVTLYRVRSSDGLLTGRFFTATRPNAALPTIDLVFGPSLASRPVDAWDEISVPAGSDLFIGNAVPPPSLSTGLLDDGFHIYVPDETLKESVLTGSGTF